jgi:HK97 gp10 family phage protein
VSVAFGVGYADISGLAERMGEVGPAAVRVTQRLVAATTEQVEHYATEYAPRKTGTLVGSIRSDIGNGGMSGTVEATAKYAIFVELGTGLRGEFPSQEIVIRPRAAKALRWVGPDGKVHFAKVVRSPGMKAKPFLRPALQRAIDELESSLGVAIAMEILRGPGGVS